MGKVTNVNNYNWPLEINCNKCGSGFAVEKPSDMFRHIEYDYNEVNGGLVPSVKRIYVTAPCPVCKERHQLSDSQVPRVFITFNAIPMAPGEVPFCG